MDLYETLRTIKLIFSKKFLKAKYGPAQEYKTQRSHKSKEN